MSKKTNRAELQREIPADVAKWAKLDKDVNSLLFKNFEEWERRNAELINKIVNSKYFTCEENLLDALVAEDPNITFDDIKNEWINLGVIRKDDQMLNLKICMDKTPDSFKIAFSHEIHDKILNALWTDQPYDDFEDKNPIPNSWDCMSYLQNIIYYLDYKSGEKWGKNTFDILKSIVITNDDLNHRLWATEQIPSNIHLSDPTINNGIKSAFNRLLSFEIWKEVDRMVDSAKNIAEQFSSFFSNILPAAGTLISESPKYKYDEKKFLKKHKEDLDAIDSNDKISSEEKEKQKIELRWAYYIEDLKKKNKTLWELLEELHKNNFDYSKIDPLKLKSYLSKVADLRLQAICDSDIAEAMKIDCININDFSNYFKELLDLDATSINLDSHRNWLKLPVKKTIIKWEHSWLNDLEIYIWWVNNCDVLPICYEIKKADIDNLQIGIEDKVRLINFLSKAEDSGDSYIFKWENVGNLIYLFYIINSASPITALDPEKQTEVEKLFWKINSSEGWEEKEWEEKEWEEKEWEKKEWEEKEWEKKEWEEKEWDIKSGIVWNNEIENKETQINNFLEKINTHWSNVKFWDWAEIRLPMWASELPGWWYQRMKIKINNVDMKNWTFTGKVFGWELKFSGKLEWRSRKFRMNQDFLDDLWRFTKDSNKIWLLPNPDKSDFNSFKNSLNNRLWTSDLSFPIQWTTWTGNKFMQKIVDEKWEEKEVEVKRFGIPWDDKSTYKIEYNPNKRSFTVSSIFNGEEKWKDWKSSKKRFSYKRDMDWNNFLIFFTQKWLKPLTEQEAKNNIQKQEEEIKMYNGNNRKINWFSFNTIKNVIKGKFWEIKKWIDAYNKKQEEKLGDILVDDWWLWRFLWDTVWRLSPALRETFIDLEQNHYNERDNRVWAKIEPFYKQFCADYDLPDTFDQEPRYIKMKWKWSLKTQVLNRVLNAKDIMCDPWIYEAAWLLLANIEKWWGPYRGLAGHENEWLWVKALLGKTHYNNFLKHKKNCIDLFATEENKDKLQDALANSEMTYIINNILWKDGGLLFGAGLESRWLPGDVDNTSYIENPSKKILSEQFAKKLDDLTKWLFNKDAVMNKIPKHNYFEKAEKDFYRTIKTGRPAEAMGNLEWMISLARTDTQVYVTKKCYLLLMLSGILDFNWNKWLRKWAYTQWKTFWFAPAMLAKNIWHSEEIATLLNEFSNWDFSNNVTAYCHKKDLLNWETNIELLIKQLDSRFNEDKMKEFDEFVESIPWKNWEGRSPALKKLQENLTDYNNENPDDLVIKNAKLISSAWLNASADAVSTRLRIENGEFKWNDQDEKADMGKFWESCAKKIKNTKDNLDWLNWYDGAKLANQILDKYLWRFWINWDNKQAVYKRINTACRYRDQIDEKNNSDSQWKFCFLSTDKKIRNKEWKEIEIEVPLWKIYESDIKKILRYWLEWFVRTHRLSSQQLPRQLKNALDDFQDFFQTAFDKWYFDNIWNKIDSKENDVFHLWWWGVYETIAQKNDGLGYINTDDDSEIDSEDFQSLPGKQQKSILRQIFNTDTYKNSEMSNMRKNLKNHWVSLDDKEWWLFNDTSKSAKEEQNYK